jgi:pyruvate dehydrogenase E2 component (dihydrolipoamide acetyltransferase)
MPKWGLTMKEGRISKWFKSEGDTIQKGEPFFEVETEKITNVVEAIADGILFQIVVSADTTVPVGTIVAVIADPGEKPERIEGLQAGEVVEEDATPSAGGSAPTAPEKPAAKKFVPASPSARRVAKQLGVDLAQVNGTGQGGKITREDVERALELQKQTEAALPVKSIPFSGMRKSIAANMHSSLQTTAQLTTFTEVDVTEMIRFRDTVREEYKKDETVKISYNDIIILATSRALKHCPIMNSTLVGEEIRLHDSVNMGIAVALPDGLIVPVLRDADKMGLLQIAGGTRELARKARAGTLTVDEVTGGTFTISNISMFQVDGVTPILKPPETGILGVGRVKEKPAVHNGEIAIRSMMFLNLTFDHQVVDGAPAAEFLQTLARYLENPYLIMT